MLYGYEKSNLQGSVPVSYKALFHCVTIAGRNRQPEGATNIVCGPSQRLAYVMPLTRGRTGGVRSVLHRFWDLWLLAHSERRRSLV